MPIKGIEKINYQELAKAFDRLSDHESIIKSKDSLIEMWKTRAEEWREIASRQLEELEALRDQQNNQKLEP